MHRILVRNGLVNHQVQVHRRSYKRWQREAPIQLWQMDLMSGVFLADGRECKLVTGIDDHSRFITIAKVVLQPSGRAVCEAFLAAMRRYGVPSEVLTDNDKQSPAVTPALPTEVMLERVCRENGITQQLTKPRSPATTRKIKRFHKTLQSLEMATPAQVFRPHPIPIIGDAAEPAVTSPPAVTVSPVPAEAMRLPELPPPRSAEENPLVTAVEFEAMINPSRHLCPPGNRSLKFSPNLAGRTVTVWANHHVMHVLLDGQLIRTRPMAFTDADLRQLLMKGGRVGGPEPQGGIIPGRPLPPGRRRRGRPQSDQGRPGLPRADAHCARPRAGRQARHPPGADSAPTARETRWGAHRHHAIGEEASEAAGTGSRCGTDGERAVAPEGT
ncbi:DDE-type integrase/transposase/recombinase [Streptomyces chartreusis]|uniref:DDE-type integrase/transposase/recombinase n=1 Tax=Streptomyces chartreusis TaxID=1969 RepID=UPI00382EF720